MVAETAEYGVAQKAKLFDGSLTWAPGGSSTCSLSREKTRGILDTPLTDRP